MAVNSPDEQELVPEVAIPMMIEQQFRLCVERGDWPAACRLARGILLAWRRTQALMAQWVEKRNSEN